VGTCNLAQFIIWPTSQLQRKIQKYAKEDHVFFLSLQLTQPPPPFHPVVCYPFLSLRLSSLYVARKLRFLVRKGVWHKASSNDTNECGLLYRNAIAPISTFLSVLTLYFSAYNLVFICLSGPPPPLTLCSTHINQ
jgi:hypothetical protein